MYHAFIKQLAQSLRNLDAILDKAAQHAEARKFDPSGYLTLKLAPDMFPFARQIQVASDIAKATAAALARKDTPSYPDTEQSLPELQTRLRKTVAFLDSIGPGDLAHLTDKTVVKIPYPKGKGMFAPEALVSRNVPNFYFHVTTAYNLLRGAGVALGKADYLGTLNTFDA
jgi:hypothetical protein